MKQTDSFNRMSSTASAGAFDRRPSSMMQTPSTLFKFRAAAAVSGVNVSNSSGIPPMMGAPPSVNILNSLVIGPIDENKETDNSVAKKRNSKKKDFTFINNIAATS